MRVERYSGSHVIPAAADVGNIQGGGPVRINFYNNCISPCTTRRFPLALKGKPGIGPAGNIGISIRVPGNGVRIRHTDACEVNAIFHDRVNNQWLAFIIGCHLEPDRIG